MPSDNRVTLIIDAKNLAKGELRKLEGDINRTNKALRDTARSARDADKGTTTSMRNMSQAGDRAADTLGRVGRSADRASTSLGTRLRGAMSGVSAGARRMRTSIGAVSRSFNDLKMRADAAQSGLIALAIGSGAFAVGAGLAVKSTIQAAANMEKLEAGLTAVAGSSKEANRVLTRLLEVAKQPGLGVPEAVKGSTNLQSVGISADFAASLLEELGNSLARIGAGKVELEGVVLGIRQMVSANKVLQEELNQITSRIPDLNAVLINTFGSARAEDLQKMNVSVNEFLKVLLTGLQGLQRVGNTTANAMENLSDSFDQTKARIGEAFLPAVKAVLTGLGDLFDRIKALSDTDIQVAAWGVAVAGALAAVTAGVAILVALLPSLSAGIGVLSTAVLPALISPVGLVVAGFVALAAAVVYFVAKSKLAKKPADELADSIAAGKRNIDGQIKSLEDQASQLRTNRDLLREVSEASDSTADASARIAVIDEQLEKNKQMVGELRSQLKVNLDNDDSIEAQNTKIKSQLVDLGKSTKELQVRRDLLRETLELLGKDDIGESNKLLADRIKLIDVELEQNVLLTDEQKRQLALAKEKLVLDQKNAVVERDRLRAEQVSNEERKQQLGEEIAALKSTLDATPVGGRNVESRGIMFARLQDMEKESRGLVTEMLKTGNQIARLNQLLDEAATPADQRAAGVQPTGLEDQQAISRANEIKKAREKLSVKFKSREHDIVNEDSIASVETQIRQLEKMIALEGDKHGKNKQYFLDESNRLLALARLRLSDLQAIKDAEDAEKDRLRGVKSRSREQESIARSQASDRERLLGQLESIEVEFAKLGKSDVSGFQRLQEKLQDLGDANGDQLEQVPELMVMYKRLSDGLARDLKLAPVIAQAERIGEVLLDIKRRVAAGDRSVADFGIDFDFEGATLDELRSMEAELAGMVDQNRKYFEQYPAGLAYIQQIVNLIRAAKIETHGLARAEKDRQEQFGDVKAALRVIDETSDIFEDAFDHEAARERREAEIQKFSEGVSRAVTQVPIDFVGGLFERREALSRLNEELVSLEEGKRDEMRRIANDEFLTQQQKNEQIVALEHATAQERVGIEQQMASARKGVFSDMVGSFIKDLARLVSSAVQQRVAQSLTDTIFSTISKSTAGGGPLSFLFGGAGAAGGGAGAGAAGLGVLANPWLAGWSCGGGIVGRSFL